MTDDVTPVDEEFEDDIDSIMAGILEYDDGEDEAPFQAEVEEAEDDADDADDRMNAALKKKVESLERKFEHNALNASVKGFLESADPIEKELMKELAGDIKTVAEFDRARRVVDKQAKRLTARSAAVEEQANKDAKERAAQAWGVGPVGQSPAPTDHSRDVNELIAKGDAKAGIRALMAGDPLMADIFG